MMSMGLSLFNIRPSCGTRFGIPLTTGKATPIESLTSSLFSASYLEKAKKEKDRQKLNDKTK